MKNRGPRVSIVTPSYNQGRFLGETIASVLSQEGDFFIDYIIADGGSTDDSVEVIQRFEEALKNGEFPVKCSGIDLQWWSRPDAGQSAALNEGFKAADGAIVAWLNSDDCYYPGAVRRAVEVFAADADVGLVYGYCANTDESGDVERILKSPEFDRQLLFRNMNLINQPATFFRRSLLEEAGYIDEDMHYAMDYDLWLRMAKLAKFKLIPEVLATYRFSPGSKSIHDSQAFWPEVDKIIRREGGLGLPRSYLFLHRFGWVHRLWSRLRSPLLMKVKNKVFGFWQAGD